MVSSEWIFKFSSNVKAKQNQQKQKNQEVTLGVI